MSNTTNQTATERAEALLTRWEQRLSQSGKQTPPATTEGTTEAESAVQRAEALLGGKGAKAEGPESSGPESSGPKSSGRGLMGAAAHVYVALAAKTGEVVTPVVKNWQASVDEARREQEQKAAQDPNKPNAQQEGSDEKEGEKALGKTADATAEAAGTAAGA